MDIRSIDAPNPTTNSSIDAEPSASTLPSIDEFYPGFDRTADSHIDSPAASASALLSIDEFYPNFELSASPSASPGFKRLAAHPDADALPPFRALFHESHFGSRPTSDSHLASPPPPPLTDDTFCARAYPRGYAHPYPPSRAIRTPIRRRVERRRRWNPPRTPSMSTPCASDEDEKEDRAAASALCAARGVRSHERVQGQAKGGGDEGGVALRHAQEQDGGGGGVFVWLQGGVYVSAFGCGGEGMRAPERRVRLGSSNATGSAIGSRRTGRSIRPAATEWSWKRGGRRPRRMSSGREGVVAMRLLLIGLLTGHLSASTTQTHRLFHRVMSSTTFTDVEDALLAPPSASDGRGGFYGFRIAKTRSTPGIIKLGRAKVPRKRQAQWARQCRGERHRWLPYYWEVPFYKKFEKIIHRHYKAAGAWVVPHRCRFCTVRHQEKFDLKACGGVRGLVRVVEYYLGRLNWPVIRRKLGKKL
ncbi:hypothetical protein B0H11DRAFT_2412504 [Mycena galericulata]|nr:hypothetical protein B0H11DRAFT_2412504 [Mycena galericulata]